MRALGIGEFLDWLPAERLLIDVASSCEKVDLPIGWRRGGFGVKVSKSIRRCF